MNQFEVFRTEDGVVSKYIHEDGSETAIKLAKSLQNILNPITNTIETRASDRNKYSVFISSFGWNRSICCLWSIYCKRFCKSKKISTC